MSNRAENWGEACFERYLAQWGNGEYEHHPVWLNPPKKPDYLIQTATGEVVVEVKSFDTWGLPGHLQGESFAMESIEQTLRPIRRAIERAAEQMEGIEGRPLVIALASPDNRVPVNPHCIISAMYGELQFRVPLGQPEAGSWQTGRNGRLYVPDSRGIRRGHHMYISAVAVIHEASGDQEYSAASADVRPGAAVGDGDPPIRLDVFETISDRCVPLLRTIFHNGTDRRWGALGDGRYGRLDVLPR